ncbi:MAG: hypothetical protein SGILL_003222 [Bacillariaceae sp.]
MPRRPLSAYNLFFKERREAMMKAAMTAEDSQPSTGRKKSNKSVGIGFANLARTIASEWKTLDPTTKAPYEARAAVEKGRYDKEMLVWRAKQREKKAATAASATGMSAGAGTSVSDNARSVSDIKAGEGLPEVSMRSSDGVDVSFQKQAGRSPMSGSMHMSFQGSSSTMDEMMMMGTQYPFQQMGARQQQRDEMGWAGFPSRVQSSSAGQGVSRFPQDSTGQLSETSSSEVQNMPQLESNSALFPQMDGISDPRQHLMMMQRQQQHMMMNMAGGGSGGSLRRFDDLLNIPSSRMTAMLGEFDNYEHQSQSVPASLGGRQVTDQMFSSMNHSISEFQRQSLALDHDVTPERRNTWSGMSQAQQGAFHQMQMERLRCEEEALQEQLREHRLRYMEHERQMQEERQRRTSLRDFDTSNPGTRRPSGNEEMAAQRVGQHPDSWTELTSESNPKAPHQATPRTAQQLQQQPSSNHYPSTWFEADTNVEDTKSTTSGDLLRYSPDLDGDLNQKLSGRTISSSSAPPFGGQQPDSGLKDGKKSEGDPWNPIQLKGKDPVSGSECVPRRGVEKMQHVEKTGTSDVPNRRVDPSSVQALGMRLDDESVSFLANLRFGGGLNTPGGSPNGGDSR